MKRKTVPPRNHVTVAMLKRKGGGAHGESVKAQRRAQRRLDKIEVSWENTRLLIWGSRVRTSPRRPAIQAHSGECVSIEGESSSGQKHRVLIPAFS